VETDGRRTAVLLFYTFQYSRREVNSVDNLKEMIACDHLSVVWQPLLNTNVPHAWIRSKAMYVVVEEGKVKLLCPDCFYVGARPTWFTVSESH
jgi:hypothetical protein